MLEIIRGISPAWFFDTLEMPGIPKIASGKVREIFDARRRLLFVATDRISAFDCILPNPIPRKGEVLTSLSAFWFAKFDFVQNHAAAHDVADFPTSCGLSRRTPGPLHDRKKGPTAAGRDASCGVSGRLRMEGISGFGEESAAFRFRPDCAGGALPETIFTPSTKADSGHDQNISFEECRRILGDALAEQVRRSRFGFTKKGGRSRPSAELSWPTRNLSLG